MLHRFFTSRPNSAGHRSDSMDTVRSRVWATSLAVWRLKSNASRFDAGHVNRRHETLVVPFLVTSSSTPVSTRGLPFQVVAPHIISHPVKPLQVIIVMPHMRDPTNMGHQYQCIPFRTPRILFASDAADWATGPTPANLHQVTRTALSSHHGKMVSSSIKPACQSASSSMSKDLAWTPP